MTPLETAVFDLIRSMAGETTPLKTLLAEVRIQPGFRETTMHEMNLACTVLARQSQIWCGPDGAKLRRNEPKQEKQGRLNLQ